MAPRELLMVGVGNMGRPFIDAARDLGLRIRVVETAAWNGTVPARDGTLEPMPGTGAAHNRLDEVWAGGVYRAITEHTPDGVLAFAEQHVLAAALAQDLLGLPGPSLHAAVLSRNKALQRARFAAHGIGQPEYHLASGMQEAAVWAGGRLPVVIKPTSESGSLGVELVGDAPTLADCVRRRFAEGPLLVEEAVDGPEFSWEGFVRDGEVLFGNVTVKETTPPPRFVELSHRCGHHFADPASAALVEEFTRGIVAAIGLRTGIAHLEFRLGPQGPAVMEIAVRTPGDYLFALLGTAYGFDPYRVCIQLAMGLEPDLPAGPEPVRYTGVYFPEASPGIVTGVYGVDAAASFPGVADVTIDVAAGDEVPDLLSSRHRIGHVLFDASSEAERDKAMEYVRSTLRVETMPLGPGRKSLAD
jgi:biotin carboxylase